MKNILTPGQERTRILHILSDSVPQTVRFEAEAVRGGGNPSGVVEVERSVFFFTHRKEEHPLQAENNLKKGMFDTSYAVFVTPDQDTKINFKTRHVTSRKLFWVLGIVLAAGLIAGLLPVILKGSG